MVASLSTLGLVVVVAGVLAYAVMLFVIHRFTYRTWIFDSIVVLGTLLAAVGWISDGIDLPGIVAVASGVA